MENNKDLFELADNDIYSSKSKYEGIVNHSYGKPQPNTNGKTKIGSWWRNLKRSSRVILISTVAFILVLSVSVVAIFSLFDYNYNDISQNPEDLGFENVINERIVNVALFGIDSREIDSFEGLSDSIMILSLNTETKKVKVTSVMRDSLVPIAYDGKVTYNKINSAYKTGGPELAIKTLNTIFDLDISEYATVNFYGMADIIDAVGGIDATLTKAELDIYGYEKGVKMNYGLNGMISEQCEIMGKDHTEYLIKKAGTYHLNGIQAVAYARIRKAANIDGTNNDFGRTDRQRYVMEQLFNKAVTLDKKKYISLAKALAPCSETSLSYSQIVSLAVNILLESPTFEQTRIPLDEYRMASKNIKRVGDCIYYDLDYAGKLLNAFIYDDVTPEAYMEINGVEKNDWYAERNE